jgi:cytochrome c-type biogenesis protein CcmF
MAEVGHFALLSALVLSSCAVVADLLGNWRSSAGLIRSGRDATILSFGCLSIAVITLAIALGGSDFDIAYVARHTSSASSLGYKIVAMWAGTGGSLLFWLWVQTGFVSIAFGKCEAHHRRFCADARVAANLVCVFFLLALTFEINPFAVSEQVSPNGASLDPRPLHPSLIIGYAAYVVSFAWSFAWLKWDNAQGPAPLFKQVRYWILPAWLFLTVGVAVGAWLVYEQVGWDGGWLRDVAWNVSLMPWLPATALLCGSRVYKRDAAAAKWMVMLSLITFSLCILAAFHTRADTIPGLRKLFVILLIHIWALAAISLWRRHRRSRRSDKT